MADIYRDALNKLCKWRTVLAGWQLGTRARGDPECDAVRDHREATLLLRAEVSGLVKILIEKGVVTHEELLRIFTVEAMHLDEAHERRFPGFKTTEDGLTVDVELAKETTRGWRP